MGWNTLLLEHILYTPTNTPILPYFNQILDRDYIAHEEENIWKNLKTKLKEKFKK